MPEDDETTLTPEEEAEKDRLEAEAERLKEEVESGDATPATLKHLKDLQDTVRKELALLRKDRQTDADEKAELQGRLDTIQQALTDLTTRLDEKGEKHDDTTIVVPPAELDPPVNPTPEEDEHEDGNEPHNSTTKKRGSWKKLW